MSTDTIAITVPTFNPTPEEGDERKLYPSVNHLTETSNRFGRKTHEYAYLFAAVQKAAWDAMDASGWWTADYYVDVYWTRYVIARRSADAMNATKCEFDAMEPDESTGFPGVYANDSLVVPHPAPPQYDPTPGAVDRISIVCQRRWYPLVVPLLDKRQSQPRKTAIVTPRASQDALAAWRTGDSIPEGFVLQNGRPVRMSIGEALARGNGGR